MRAAYQPTLRKPADLRGIRPSSAWSTRPPNASAVMGSARRARLRGSPRSSSWRLRRQDPAGEGGLAGLARADEGLPPGSRKRGANVGQPSPALDHDRYDTMKIEHPQFDLMGRSRPRRVPCRCLTQAHDGESFSSSTPLHGQRASGRLMALPADRAAVPTARALGQRESRRVRFSRRAPCSPGGWGAVRRDIQPSILAMARSCGSRAGSKASAQQPSASASPHPRGDRIGVMLVVGPRLPREVVPPERG